MSNRIEISGIILSGGRGSRMQGRDKGLVLLDGKPLVRHVIDRIAYQVDDIVISANRNTDAYASSGFHVVADSSPGYEGPLAGIRASLPHCRHDRVLVVAVDLPYLPTDLVSVLCRELNGTQLAIAEAGSRLQPAFVMHKRLLDSVEKYFEQGGRSLMDWIRTTPCSIVQMTDDSAFTNMNRPEQAR